MTTAQRTAHCRRSRCSRHMVTAWPAISPGDRCGFLKTPAERPVAALAAPATTGTPVARGPPADGSQTGVHDEARVDLRLRGADPRYLGAGDLALLWNRRPASAEDRSTAMRRNEEMRHAIHRVEHLRIVAPYTRTLRFEDGIEQLIDFRPVLEGEVLSAAPGSQRVQRRRTGPDIWNHTVAERCRLRSRDTA